MTITSAGFDGTSLEDMLGIVMLSAEIREKGLWCRVRGRGKVLLGRCEGPCDRETMTQCSRFVAQTQNAP